LESLRRQGVLENTVVVFSADHGDYLGDHNLIGKGTFFESSTRVPMLVSLPSLDESRVCDDLVCLGDVTATLLHLAGCEIPAHMDSIPLPELGIPIEAPRTRVFGTVQGGWMIDDGRWRLAKYSTGEAVLFDREWDPDEQDNLYGDAAHLDVRTRLEAELTQYLMASVREANHDRRVYVRDLSQTTAFGREGWQRPYPRRMGDR
jgi:arylsulfatase A-like enzyme